MSPTIHDHGLLRFNLDALKIMPTLIPYLQSPPIYPSSNWIWKRAFEITQNSNSIFMSNKFPFFFLCVFQ